MMLFVQTAAVQFRQKNNELKEDIQVKDVLLFHVNMTEAK